MTDERLRQLHAIVDSANWHGSSYIAARLKEAYETIVRLKHLLKIYNHAHTTGNTVPPHIVAEVELFTLE